MNVSPYRLRALLWAGSACFLAASVAVGACALLWPTDTAASGARTAEGSAGLAARTDRGKPPLKEYAPTWQRDLRRPLFDPTPPPTHKAKPNKPKLRIRLTGVVLEPGFTYAFLKTADNRTLMRQVGDKIEGAEIKAIEEGRITVLHAGDTITLKMVKDENKR